MQQNVASPQGVSEPSQGAVRSEASCQTSTGTGTFRMPAPFDITARFRAG